MDRSLDEILAERQQVRDPSNAVRRLWHILTTPQSNRRGRGPRNDPRNDSSRGGGGRRRGERQEYPRDGVRKVGAQPATQYIYLFIFLAYNSNAFHSG